MYTAVGEPSDSGPQIVLRTRIRLDELCDGLATLLSGCIGAGSDSIDHLRIVVCAGCAGLQRKNRLRDCIAVRGRLFVDRARWNGRIDVHGVILSTVIDGSGVRRRGMLSGCALQR